MPESIIERFSTKNEKKKPPKNINKLNTKSSKVKKNFFSNNDLNMDKGAKENGEHLVLFYLSHFRGFGIDTGSQLI